MTIAPPTPAGVRLLPPFVPQQGDSVGTPEGRPTFAGRLGVCTVTSLTWNANGPTAGAFTLGRPSDRADARIAEGWRTDVQAGGVTVWQGRIGNVDRGTPWTVSLEGIAAQDPPLDANLDGSVSGFDARDVTSQVIRAVQRGEWPVQPPAAFLANLPATAQAPADVLDLLNKTSDAAGRLWRITPLLPGIGLLSFVAAPLSTDAPVARVNLASLPDAGGVGAPDSVVVSYVVSDGATGTLPRQVRVLADTPTLLRRGVRPGKLDVSSYGVLPLATAQALGRRYLLGARTGVPGQITVPAGAVRYLGDQTSTGRPGGGYACSGRVARFLPGRSVIVTGVGGGTAGSPLVQPAVITVKEVTWDVQTDLLTLTAVGADDLTLLGRLAELAVAL